MTLNRLSHWKETKKCIFWIFRFELVAALVLLFRKIKSEDKKKHENFFYIKYIYIYIYILYIYIYICIYIYILNIYIYINIYNKNFIYIKYIYIYIHPVEIPAVFQKVDCFGVPVNWSTKVFFLKVQDKFYSSKASPYYLFVFIYLRTWGAAKFGSFSNFTFTNLPRCSQSIT